MFSAREVYRIVVRRGATLRAEIISGSQVLLQHAAKCAVYIFAFPCVGDSAKGDTAGVLYAYTDIAICVTKSLYEIFVCQ
jgi:hypothetical protein